MSDILTIVYTACDSILGVNKNIGRKHEICFSYFPRKWRQFA